MRAERCSCFCVVLLIGAGIAAGDTHCVSDGQSIQAAIDAADSGDAIEVAPGTYAGGIRFMGKAVHLYSSDGPDVTIIDAAWQDRVIYCDHGERHDTILEGFTLTGGSAYSIAEKPGPYAGNYQGGGMYNDGTSPTVANCVFRYNSSMSSGGGMWNENASPTVTHCLFVDNHAQALGGDMYNRNSSPTIAYCTFTGSRGRWAGSLANYSGSSPAIVNCAFTQCMSERGGVMVNSSSRLTIAGCLFCGNTAAFMGAVMYSSDSDLTMTNCTFVDNAIGADYGEGGILYNEDCTPVVTNCIFWSNSTEAIVGGPGKIVYSLVQGGWPGRGNIDADPLFVGAADYHLAAGSPCIDAGTNSPVGGLPRTDLDGHPRVTDGNGNGTQIVDMGVYETPAVRLNHQLTDLICYVRSLHLGLGTTKSLTVKLDTALRAITSSHPNVKAGAVGVLNGFCKEVKAQRRTKIPAAEADILIERTQSIIRMLRGG